jgi:hypothetical protein
MGRFLVTSEWWVKAAWVLPVALLALPNCTFTHGVSAPATSAVFCDMRVNLQERRCATAADLAMGIRLPEAAIALAQGQSSAIGIDDSPAALARCAGQPEAVTFAGPFPKGSVACIDPDNFGAGNFYPDTESVCVQQCLNVLDSPSPADPVLVDFCRGRTNPSTGASTPFGNGCTSGGNPVEGWPDPRLSGETIVWQNQANVVISGGDIQRTTPSTGPLDFTAGGASTQLVTSGDGYVEFTAAENNTVRLGGFTAGDGAGDTNTDFANIGFAIDLFKDSHFYVFESGVKQSGPDNTGDTPGAWGTYAFNDRFRISFKDNFDGTATVSYARLPGPCQPGADCPAPPFFTSATHIAYPFHVDASLRDLGATLIDVRLVFIH